MLVEGESERKTKFLGPANIHGAYADCIRDAKQKLTLVMPWFTPSPQLRDALLSALDREVQVCVVTRPPWEAKSDQHDDNLIELLARQRRVTRRRLLGLMPGDDVELVEVLLVENVHAKTVIQDERRVVVSSSNLNVMSIGRNTEFGILSMDKEVVAEALAAIATLRSSDRCASLANGQVRRCACPTGWLFEAEATKCDRCPEIVAPPPPLPAPVAVPAIPVMTVAARPAEPSAAAAGHCIRCRAGIPRNTERPLCASCYRSWARYKNDEYEEKHCHVCGSEETTSMRKPLCRRCYRASLVPAR